MDGYDVHELTHDRITHEVYHRGDGPAVVVLHEASGLDRKCRILGDRLAAEGFHVFLPLLFGPADVKPSNLRMVTNLARLCIGREFRLFFTNGDSPVLDWLRRVCAAASTHTGGGPVGVIGMCLTGNFAISLVAEPAVEGAVSCQPSFPLGRKTTLGVVDVDRVRERANGLTERHGGPSILSYRFADDRMCPAARIRGLGVTFPHAFRAMELPGAAHSTLTHDFVGSPGDIRTPANWAEQVPAQAGLFFARDVWAGGEPTHNALIEVIAFLRARLM